MKPLPLHTIPAARMAALTTTAARVCRAARIERARANWHDVDRSQDDAGRGGCAFVGCLAVALLIYAVLAVRWFF